jgi:hypothetical protein
MSLYMIYCRDHPRSLEYGEVSVILERIGAVRKGFPSCYVYQNFSLRSSQGEVRESRETISPKSPCRIVPGGTDNHATTIRTA